jgi:hypothetical protein
VAAPAFAELTAASRIVERRQKMPRCNPFSVEASRQSAKSMAQLSDQKLEMAIYQAEAVNLA